MGTTLHQLVAVEKGVRKEAVDAITAVYHLVQKPGLFEGIARNYVPNDEEGEQLPGESTRVQYRAAEILANTVQPAWVRLLDLTATKDSANAEAKASIVIDGEVIAADLPVSFLIWLEKQLLDVATVIGRLPVLDTASLWELSTSGDWATPVVRKARTKKVPRSFEKAPATDKHAAQVEMWYEDVAVGTWETIAYSGAMPAVRQRELLARVAKLQAAVKFARQEANCLEVTDQKVGGALFAYLLA